METNTQRFSDAFLDFLEKESRNPKEVTKHCSPFQEFGLEIKMCNGVSRYIKFKGGQKQVFSEKGKELAPIIFFNKFSNAKITRVYLTEGETDAFALARFTNAIISIPGAHSSSCFLKNIAIIKQYLPEDEYEFCILFDNDQPGTKGALELENILLQTFTGSRISKFEWGDLQAKDVRDALVTKVLTYDEINKRFDCSNFISSSDAILSEITQPDQLQKCPLDYCEDSGTLTWVIKSNEQEIVFESGNKLNIKSLSNSSFKFSDKNNANTLEKFETDLIKNLNTASWGDVTLLNDIKSLLSKRVNTSEENLSLVSCYIILSYMYPIFKHVPYLYLSGMKGSGKSTLSELIAQLSFNGEHLSCPTPASTRRLIHARRGLISIDDAEMLSSDNEETQIFRSQLNSGYETRAITMLCNLENKTEMFFIGGPKIFNSINGLESVLSSRTLFLKMKFAENFKGSPSLGNSGKTVRNIRARGIINALMNHNKIKARSKLFSLEMSRENDLLIPLLSIASFFDELNNTDSKNSNLIKKAIAINKELKGEKWSFEMCLINALFETWVSKGRPREMTVLNSEIKELLNLYHDDSIPSKDSQITTKIGETIRQLELSLLVKRALSANSRKSTGYLIKVDLLESFYKRLIPQQTNH